MCCFIVETCLDRPEMRLARRDTYACWLDDLHAHAQAGFVNRQDSVVRAAVYLQFSSKD